MRLLTPLLVLLLCIPQFYGTGACGRAQDTLRLDSVPLVQLPTAMLAGAPHDFKHIVAAPLENIRLQELPAYDDANLLPALNRVAGVRFEQRATASYRLAIRGASLRAPFGVRNVQVYWNGIPFGEPGGDVPLNFLDRANVDEVTIIRGPNGGRFGPGTAGTLLLSTRPFARDTVARVQLSMSGGSYGFARGAIAVARPNKFRGMDDFRISHQRTDGYREHSAMERTNIQFSSQLGNDTKLHALYTDLSYELPGGLNAEQFAVNPRQARPGSVDKNASINYKNLLVGLTTRKRIGHLTSNSAIYATGFYFDHPFNFDYKREANLAAGGRSTLTYFKDDWAVTAAVMVQAQQRNGQNFENEAGKPGNLNFADEVYSMGNMALLEGFYAPGDFDFKLSMTTSTLSYSVDRTFNANGETGITDFSTTQPLSVRLSAGYRFGDWASSYVYAAVADGFSPPTLDEFRTNEGSLNVGLAPEVGTNYEIGYRYSYGALRVEAIAFYFALDEAITTFTDDRGTQLFRNAGKTQQLGLELTAEQRQLTQIFGGNLSGRATYTFYNFSYRELSRDGTDFSGQSIPGAAPHTLNLELAWQHADGLYLSLFNNFTDATPLNDANDVHARSFNNMRGNIGYKWKKYNVFVSGNNLLNDELNLGYDLNVRFGGRYFQPAPGRTWLAGVRVEL